MYIDSTLVVNNDGLHGTRSVCKNAALVPGRHSIEVEGFKGTRSHVEMKLTYSGPDTGGLSATVRSVGTRDPPGKRKLCWGVLIDRHADRSISPSVKQTDRRRGGWGGECVPNPSLQRPYTRAL